MIHVLGLPYFDTTRDNATCAFTQQNRRLCDMLTMRGHPVTLYGRAVTDANVAEFVPCVDPDEFPSPTLDTVFDEFDAHAPIWVKFNATVITELAERLGTDDMIAVTMGTSQKPITDAFLNHISFESGVGYEGSYLPYRVFPSRAWQHHTYGRQGINDGRFYDTVIPHGFDPADFTPRFDHDGYLLFLGRHTPRKGLAIVAELAKAGHRVITAGQGEPIPGCEYVGPVAGDEKAKLLAGAKALVCPTTYIEPFGMVAVEAQLSGTPVIATPWGAYPETVEQNRTGFLCHSLSEFRRAVDLVDGLDHRHIFTRAQSLYTEVPISHQYDAYLERLNTLNGDGWYT